MRALRDFFEEYSYGGLTAIAFGITVFLIGAGSIIVGGIWILWQPLAALGLPTMLLFRGAMWLFFWPGLLIAGQTQNQDELAMITMSGSVWFICLAVILNAGRLTFRRFVS